MKKLTKIQNAIDLLKKGEIIILPTDTIYGISCLYNSEKAVDDIYTIKKRDKTKPCILLISNIDQLGLFGINPTQKEREFTKTWPDITTIVFKCPDQRFKYLHKGQESLAIRLTRNAVCKQIIDEVGPILSTSVNIEGEKPIETFDEAEKIFGDNDLVAGFYDVGKLKDNASRVVRFDDNGELEFLR